MNNYEKEQQDNTVKLSKKVCKHFNTVYIGV